MRRRSFLAALGGAALAGGAAVVARRTGGDSADGWGEFCADPHNSGRQPAAPGPSEGRLRWSVRVGREAIGGPVVRDGTVYVARAADPGGIVAFDAADGSRRWERLIGGANPLLSDVSTRIAGPLAVRDGTVFVGTEGREIVALDADRGERRWSVDLDGRVPDRPLTAAGGLVLAAADDTLFALAADDGRRRWQHTFDRRGDGRATLTAPAVSGGRVYVATRAGRLHSLAVASGGDRGATTLDANVAAPPVIAGETVLVVGEDSSLIAVDATTGRVRWRAGLAAPRVRYPPAVADGRVVVGSGTPFPDRPDPVTGTAADDADEADQPGAIKAFSLATGRREWTVSGHFPTTPPAIAGGRIHVGDPGGVVALELATGRRRWRLPLDGVPSPPAVAGDALYTTADGAVRAAV